MKTDNKHMGRNRNHKKEIRKRIGTMLLSLIVAVSMMPVFAFADETPVPDDQAPAEAAEIREEPAAQEDEPTETVITDEEVTEEPEVIEEQAADENGSLDFGELELTKPDVELKDADDLLSEYIDNGIREETGTTLTAPSADTGISRIQKKARLAGRVSVLNANEKAVYEQLKAKVAAIAEGSANRTDIRVTYYGDVDYHSVLNALMLDLPYEFYWYDKTVGYMYGSNYKEFLYLFSVSKDYADSSVYYGNYEFVCGVDTGKAKSTKAAVDNVSDIINEFSDKSDVDKLYGYRNRVCEFASYDNDAVRRSNAYYARINSGLSADPFYGDPWQLIYVFDGNDSTNVVCEGYSKAFQYLCNRTDFADSGIECHTVSGDLYNGTRNLGGHMWNIIHMGNGGNYIADITNCDNGQYATENYFLKGYSAGNVDDGYTFSRLTYLYDDETFGGYTDEHGDEHTGMYTEQELTLSDSDYGAGEPAVTHIAAKEASCTVSGNKECWRRLGYYYSDESCTDSSWMSHSQVVIKDSHEWSAWTTAKAATCTAAGAQKRTCGKCGASETRAVPAHGHAWRRTVLLDSDSYRCAHCGSSYSVSKVIVDLPKVSINKPGRAKASFTAKWKKVSKKNRSKIGGIEIQYSTRRDFASSYTVTTAKKTAASKKFKKLARKTTYYVRVRSYRWISGKKHVSAWSAVKSVKTK